MAWGAFTQLDPLFIYCFARQSGLQDADAALVTLDVVVSVARTIYRFEYNRKAGSFRGCMKVVTRSGLTDFRRTDKPLRKLIMVIQAA